MFSPCKGNHVAANVQQLQEMYIQQEKTEKKREYHLFRTNYSARGATNTSYITLHN